MQYLEAAKLCSAHELKGRLENQSDGYLLETLAEPLDLIIVKEQAAKEDIGPFQRLVNFCLP